MCAFIMLVILQSFGRIRFFCVMRKTYGREAYLVGKELANSLMKVTKSLTLIFICDFV